MRTVLLLILLVAAITAADVPTVTCKPVMITACAELPASIGFQERPMGYELGCQISYLVSGEDLIGFKDDSLAITSISTADGKNIANKRNGNPAWKMGSFPKTTDDGKFGIFTIEVSENVFGKTDGLNVIGTIVALSGSDRQTQKVTFTLSQAKEEDIGGLKVRLVGANKEQEKKQENAPGNPFSGGSFFGGGGFGVQITGDLAKVANVVLLEGTTKLDSQGSQWSGSQRTWNFTKPTGDSVTLELSYWNKLTTITVPIGKK